VRRDNPLLRYALAGTLAVVPATAAGQIPGFQGAGLEQFLERADVVRIRPIGRGVTGARRVTLVDGAEQRDASWKTIEDVRSGITRLGRRYREAEFEDTYRGECAAYELDRLLNLGMVPATVERVISGERGALTLWITRAISEAQRVEQGIPPPDYEAWTRQLLKMRFFDNLIHNMDRHPENMLVTEDWQLRLIDHSRSFRKAGGLRDAEGLTRFSRSLLQAAERLDEDLLKARLGRLLSIWQIRAILERRDRLVELARSEAARRGEAMVYYP
jgi:hypothetical protein